MRISISKTGTVVAIAAVAALGAQYASAAPNHGANQVHNNVAPLRNIAYVSSASSTGGTGEVAYSIPTPPRGIYEGSFSANFFPEGTPSAPETFSCFLVKDGTTLRAQSTVSTTYSSGFYAGVNGSNTIKVAAGDTFQLYCGTADGTAWSWGSRPAQVTLTRLDGTVPGVLAATAHKAGSLSVAGSTH
ncbi:MAG: hypothetical protein QOI51_2518 [Nocardioidaceae bacterium]|jgi:hypothetical protein|nr:hypothetical protein [Nocardioidaceae bacterium]MDX6309605.1 hypothetical protein [Nocardioidaceae bacterium]